MAVRKPLVIIAGQVQELPVADSISTGITKFPLVCDTIDVAETLTVPAAYQFIVASKLNNSGTILNSGRVHVL